MTEPHEPRDGYDGLTRQDEAMSPEEFALEQSREPDLGNWPEIAGAILTALILWMSFTFTG